MCEKLKDKREVWIKRISNKIKDAAKKVKASTYKINIVNKIINDVQNFFNGENDFWTNKQVLGMREVFRGVVVKSWVAFPTENINFRVHNKIIVHEAA